MAMHRDHATPNFHQVQASAVQTADTEQLSLLLVRLAAIEFLAVFAAAYVTGMTYFRVVLHRWPPTEGYISSAGLIAALVLLVSIGFQHYVNLQTQPRHRFLWNGIGAVALAFSFFLSILFLLKVSDDYSRATFFFQLFVVALAVIGVRTLSHATIRSAISGGRLKARRAILISTPAHHSGIADRLADAGVHVLRSLPFPAGAAHTSSTICLDIDHAQSRQIVEICRTLNPDDILILSTAADLPRSAKLADILSELPVSLHMIPVGAGNLPGAMRLGELGNLVTMQLLHPPLSLFDRALKRTFDITVAMVGLVMLAPALVFVSIAIKLDTRGPILFRQTRHGYNNQTIRVFKFRTMTAMEDGHAFTQAKKDDPRVTAVGRVLRRTNIDELPQLLNVIIGDMSIVGPRPHPIALNKKFEQHISPFSRRHNVKPGITGWAQVNGFRGETDTLEKMQRRFEYDLYYIDNWSFMIDMKIILMTMVSKSAYLNAC
jgi:Undecaprenyl-phosphate glucose phosphotransferase